MCEMATEMRLPAQRRLALGFASLDFDQNRMERRTRKRARQASLVVIVAFAVAFAVAAAAAAATAAALLGDILVPPKAAWEAASAPLSASW